MLHYFDTETACAYGVTEAILLNHFAYWIARNREAGRNFREGRTWTHCTMKELGQVFPYLTKGQIRHALEGLREKGVLLTGRYNAIPYDRTLWYALADPDLCVCSAEQMKELSSAAESSGGNPPIPDNNQDNDPHHDPDRERTRARMRPPEQKELRDYCAQRGSGIDPEAFYDYYAARGWMYGPGQPMGDWKAAVRSWERRQAQHPEKAPARSAEEIYADIFAGRI